MHTLCFDLVNRVHKRNLCPTGAVIFNGPRLPAGHSIQHNWIFGTKNWPHHKYHSLKGKLVLWTFMLFQYQARASNKIMSSIEQRMGKISSKLKGTQLMNLMPGDQHICKFTETSGTKYVDTFTVSLESSGAVQGDCQWRWQFPPAMWAHNPLRHEAIPTYI